MRELATISDLRAHLRSVRDAGRRIGLVPTMGAIHDGHRSLMRAARADCGEVVVSIFVNPTQFSHGEDYQDYPRPLQADRAACADERVDTVFRPSVAEMYGDQDATTVTVSRLTEVLCGPYRLGHFQGVTTVVGKLFNIVQPDAAYFGRKDAQQAVVIRRMVRDLCWPIDIVVCPTVREPDGLAISSRNTYLTPEQRTQAASLYAALAEARERIGSGQRDVALLRAIMRDRLESAGPCVIDYIELVDAEELTPMASVSRRCLIALAVRIGSARLIDNVVVDAGRTEG